MKKLFLRSTCLILIISMLCAVSAFAAEPALSKQFSDITKETPHYDAITAMVNAGIINGYEDGTFRPSQPLTVGEFSILMCRTFYPDIKITAGPSSYAENYIKLLLNNSIVNNNYDGIYSTDNKHLVTRRTVAAAIIRITNIKTICYECYDYEGYSDWTQMHDVFKDAFMSALLAGYISPCSKASVNPNGTITRAEFCESLYQAKIINSNPTLGIPPVLQGISLKYLDKNAEKDCVSTITEMKLIPQVVLDSFNRNGWTLQFTNNNMDKVLGYDEVNYSGLKYSNATGMTIPSLKTITIKSDMSLYWDRHNAVIHEFGHYLDQTTGILTEVQPCYDTELTTLKKLTQRDYCAINTDEFFAEAFQEYCRRGPEAFGEFMPLTKVVIEDALELNTTK